MKKTILTSAVIAAVFGLGVDANAKWVSGKSDGRIATSVHSHLVDAYPEAFPKKDERGRTMYQPESFRGYTGKVYTDPVGRSYLESHMKDAPMDNMIGSPMEKL